MAGSGDNNWSISMQSPEALTPKEPVQSNLSLDEDAVDNILHWLPLNDSIRCGVLSSKLSNSWRFNRNLIFDSQFARGRTKTEITAIVNSILDKHVGEKINKFHLFFDPSHEDRSLVLHWLEVVVSKQVEDLNLEFCPSKLIPGLHFDLLSKLKTLNSLKLYNCDIRVSPLVSPQINQTWPHLKHLSLRRSNVKNEFFATILSHCSRLESLVLIECCVPTHLRLIASGLRNLKKLLTQDCSGMEKYSIDMPSLHHLYFHGRPCTIELGCEMRNLDDVVFHFKALDYYMSYCKKDDLAISLTKVKNLLRINNSFAQRVLPITITSPVPNLRYPLVNVKELELTVNNITEIDFAPYAMVSIVENCPNLERLDVDFGPYEYTQLEFWNMFAKPMCERTYNPTLEKLKEIVWLNCKFGALEMDLLEFFLGKSRRLENVIVIPKGGEIECLGGREKFLWRINSWIASPYAKVSILASLPEEKVRPHIEYFP